MTTTPDSPGPTPPSPAIPPRSRGWLAFTILFVVAAVVIVILLALLMNIQERKEEAKSAFIRTVAVNDATTDPAVWAKNWPNEFDSYQRTADTTRTRFGGHGGSDAMPEEKIQRDPWLKRMFLGYAFSIDYRDRRGHAYMLSDQEHTERVTKKPQPGACLQCHASIIPTYRRIGLESQGKTLADANGFDWPAVMAGFEKVCAMKYTDAHAELLKTPDGSAAGASAAPKSSVGGKPATVPTTQEVLASHAGEAHPVSCVDCHDPASMQLRVTRPGFINGIKALAESSDPVPHLASIERWRQGNRAQSYDPNVDATRQEMRSFVCGQCHVEYYFKGDNKVVTYPWFNGLKVEQIEKYYDDVKWTDYKHGETGAAILKAQHPEFELWSQGIHARSGVACADCHMPYQRVGASKVSDHWVRSPLLNINRACQTCHRFPEDELKARAEAIQTRNHDLLERTGTALMAAIDAVTAGRKAGMTDADLQPALLLQRKAQWRLDYIAAENSMGFHAPQEAARILGEAIDYARQAQVAAMKPAGAATAPPAK